MKKRKSNYYNQRFYAIFRRDEGGNLLGYIEHSFSMSWSDKLVRIWAESSFKPGFFGNKSKVDEWMRRSDYVLVRVNSKKCPAHIDLNKDDNRKFQFRNKEFTIKS